MATWESFKDLWAAIIAYADKLIAFLVKTLDLNKEDTTVEGE